MSLSGHRFWQQSLSSSRILFISTIFVKPDFIIVSISLKNKLTVRLKVILIKMSDFFTVQAGKSLYSFQWFREKESKANNVNFSEEAWQKLTAIFFI